MYVQVHHFMPEHVYVSNNPEDNVDLRKKGSQVNMAAHHSDETLIYPFVVVYKSNWGISLV